MAAIRFDLDEGDGGACRVEGMHDLAAFGGRKEPVAGEGNQAKARLAVAERLGKAPAMIGGEVEIVHRARHVEVGIRIETIDEGHALVAQIAFDLEVRVEAEGQPVAVLQVAAELAVQRRLREIGDVGGHAGDGEALLGRLPNSKYFPPCHSGSAITACRPTS